MGFLRLHFNIHISYLMKAPIVEDHLVSTVWSVWLCRNTARFNARAIGEEEICGLIKWKAWLWLRVRVSSFIASYYEGETDPNYCLANGPWICWVVLLYLMGGKGGWFYWGWWPLCVLYCLRPGIPNRSYFSSFTSC